MKYYPPFLLMVCLLSSCVQPGANKIASENIDTVFLHRNLQKFIESHSDWSQNEVKNAEINTVFMDSINVWKNNKDFLKGLIFTLDNVDEYKEDGQTVYGAVFKKHFFDPEKPSVSMDIMGIVSKSDVNKLTSGKHYVLQGEIIKTLDRKPGFVVDYYDLGAYRFKITGFHQTD